MAVLLTSAFLDNSLLSYSALGNSAPFCRIIKGNACIGRAVQKSVFFKKLRGGLLLGLGYMLSPLSWWNDLFFNFPIAYAFGWVVNLVYPDTLIAATVVGYWISNVLGFILMQFGAGDVVFSDRPRNLNKDLIVSFGTSTLYTIAVVALLQFHILETPSFLLSQP